jgi:predicted  nucleic acid-binding Zn-ribbon protein
MCAFHSLHSSMEQYHQLQKECEDLKDAKSAAEMCLVTFKTRVQQLEKEAQTNDQLLSKLENQVLFLSEDNPLQ